MEKSSKNTDKKPINTLTTKNEPKEEGILEVLSSGYGFLRKEENSYSQCDDDVYLKSQEIKKFGLRTGDKIECEVRDPNGRDKEKYRSVSKILSINSGPSNPIKLTHFSKLTPCFADERILLETNKLEISTRICDLIAPLGKGQRGLIIAPPKAGKTFLLKKIANSIVDKNPDIHVFILLVDERPEEVTDFKESVPRAVVISSTFDQHPKRHIQVTEMTIERAKRIVESGGDVVILMDSITRVARAYNLVEPSSGRTLSGGIDVNALQKPKKIFGAARNTREAGSLTILATALVDTGSKMDDIIFEEFKGTGNMELCLDRKISDSRIYPAINIAKSGTRREELLITKDELERMWVLRKHMNSVGASESIQMLIEKMKKTESNVDFLLNLRVN